MITKALFFCCIIIGITLPACYAEEEILIITEEWPPYNYLKDGEITGFSTEIVRSLLGVLKKNYQIQILPSMRSTATLNNRPHTMMFSMFRTPAREALYKWIGPLADASIYFYKRKDVTEHFDSLEDIKNTKLTICSRQAGLIHDLLIKIGIQNLDATATKSLSIYHKLAAGRCDLAISDTDLGVVYNLKLLKLTPTEVFEKIQIPIFESELYIAASRDISDKEIRQWQSALETFKTSDAYDQILLKYQK